MKTKKWYLIVLFPLLVSIRSNELCAGHMSLASYSKFSEWCTPKTIGATLFAGAVGLAGYKFLNIFNKKDECAPSSSGELENPRLELRSSDHGKEDSSSSSPSDLEREPAGSRTPSPVRRVHFDDAPSATACSRNSVPSLLAFINSHVMQKIYQILDGMNPKEQTEMLYGSFLVVDGLSADEIERELSPFIAAIRSELAVTSDRAQLRKFQQDIQLGINALDELREGIACKMLLVADDEKTLLEQIEQKFSCLTKVGVSIDGAYEVLGFDRNRRNEISIRQIREAYKTLSEAYHTTETPEGKKVRQAGYVLSNPYGKKMYDAFLSGEDHLAMMRIPREYAEKCGIEFMAPNIKLITAKNAMGALQKAIDAKLKS